MKMLGTRRTAVVLLFWSVASNIEGIFICARVNAEFEIYNTDQNYNHHVDSPHTNGHPRERHLRRRLPRGADECPPKQYYDKAVKACSLCDDIIKRCEAKVISCPKECDNQLIGLLETKQHSVGNGTVKPDTPKISGSRGPNYYFIITLSVTGGPLIVFIILCMIYVCKKKMGKIRRSSHARCFESVPESSQMHVELSEDLHRLLPNTVGDTDDPGHQGTVTSNYVSVDSRPMTNGDGDTRDANESQSRNRPSIPVRNIPPLNNLNLGEGISSDPNYQGNNEGPSSSFMDLGSMPESVAPETEMDSGHESTDGESENDNLSEDGYRLTVDEKPDSQTKTEKVVTTTTNQYEKGTHTTVPSLASHFVSVTIPQTPEKYDSNTESCITQADQSQDDVSDDEEVSVKQVTGSRMLPNGHCDSPRYSTDHKELTSHTPMKMSIEADDSDLEKMPESKSGNDQSFLKTCFSETEPKKGSLLLDLRENSGEKLFDSINKASTQECGDTPTIPIELRSGRHSARTVFFRIDWIEEYLKFKDKWEVNITPGYSVSQAKEMLRDLTGLSSNQLQVNTYESCGSFERHGPGVAEEDTNDGSDLVIQANPELDIDNLPLSVSQLAVSDQKYDLRIGERIYWDRNGQLFSVTIGSFVRVTSDEGDVCICAQTNCEGAKKNTNCYVFRDGRYVSFGVVLYTLEDPCYEHITYDTMLIKIDLIHFEPLAMINVTMEEGGHAVPHALKIAKTKMSHLKPGCPIKKLTSNQVTEIADGKIMYPEINNKKGHYYGLTGVTTLSDPPGSVSLPGDCGTLMVGRPFEGSMEVYGAVFGIDCRKDQQTGARTKFTVLIPIKESFDRLKQIYHLQNIEFVGAESISEDTSSLNDDLVGCSENEYESSVCTTDGMTDYFDNSVQLEDPTSSAEKEFMVDSGFQTMPNSPNKT